MDLNMSKKISSDFTKVFQLVFIIQFVGFSIIFFISLFLFDLKVFSIFCVCWLLGFFILRKMGITKLKTVFWNAESLSIGKLDSKISIPISAIKEVSRTFLFDDFPFKIKYLKMGKVEELYFLPKGKFFQDFKGGNEIIEALRKEIKKSKANSI